jgi:hypothetical protein
VFLRKDVEIGLAQHSRGVAQAETRGQDLVDADEAAGGVSEVDVVDNREGYP